jgi:hypothetical protein
MTTKVRELLARIEQLERKVRDLEARPLMPQPVWIPYYVPPYYGQPYIPPSPIPHWPTYPPGPVWIAGAADGTPGLTYSSSS